MTIHYFGGKVIYRFDVLSNKELEANEEMLMQAMDEQTWFGVTHSSVLQEEIFLYLQ